MLKSNHKKSSTPQTSKPQLLTIEEQKYGLTNTTTDQFIDAQCAIFQEKINAALSEKEISDLIYQQSLMIWEYAKNKVQNSKQSEQNEDNWNDQALYKGRLKMRIALKESSNNLLKDIPPINSLPI